MSYIEEWVHLQQAGTSSGLGRVGKSATSKSPGLLAARKFKNKKTYLEIVCCGMARAMGSRKECEEGRGWS